MRPRGAGGGRVGDAWWWRRRHRLARRDIRRWRRRVPGRYGDRRVAVAPTTVAPAMAMGMEHHRWIRRVGRKRRIRRVGRERRGRSIRYRDDRAIGHRATSSQLRSGDSASSRDSGAATTPDTRYGQRWSTGRRATTRKRGISELACATMRGASTRPRAALTQRYGMSALEGRATSPRNVRAV